MTNQLNRDSPPVAIVILNWNNWPDTLECLESALRLDYPAFQVVVCDNGSTDGSVGRLLDWAAGRLDVVPERRDMEVFVRPPVNKPVSVLALTRAEAEHAGGSAPEDAPVVLISNGANLGFAAGCNTGLRYALARGFEFVWLLNADTVVPPGALQPLVTRLTASPQTGLCGSLLCYYDAPEVIQEAGGCAYYPLLGLGLRLMKNQPADQQANWAEVERRLSYVSGAACLVRQSFLREIGLMTEDYFLYGEEIDWAIRARDRFKLALAPDSVVYHKKGRTTGSTSYNAGRSATSAYYLWRARCRVTRRYHALGLPAVVSLGLISAAWAYAKGDGHSARAIMLGTFDRELK